MVVLIQRLLALVLVLSVAAPVYSATTPYHLEAAKSYMKASQWDYACYEWRKILEEDPKDLQAVLGLGQALIESGHPHDAIWHLEASLKLVQDPAIQVMLADVYATQRGETRKRSIRRAYMLLTDALAKDPVNQPAFRSLKKLADKLPATQKKLAQNKLAQLSKDALDKAKQAVLQNNYKEASKQYGIGLIQYSKNKALANDYALALILGAENQHASYLFDQLLKKSDYWAIQANAAIASLATGKTYQARWQLEKALASCKDNSDKARLYNNLGYVYEQAQKPTKARFAYERAVELDPSLQKARMNLAYTYQTTEVYALAVEQYKALLKQTPKSAETLTKLGFVYELMQKTDNAVSAYRDAIAANPAYEDAYYNLGTLYRKLDKQEKAAEQFKKISELEFNKIESGTTPDSEKEEVLEVGGAEAQQTPPVQQASNGSGAKKPELLTFWYVFFSDKTLNQEG